VNKFIVAYGTYTNEEVTYIAEHFDLVDTYLSKAAQVSLMEVTNPSLKVLSYRDTIAYSGAQSWYALDAGHQIKHADWGWLLADISIPAYRTYMANLIASDLASNTMFD